jgi:hypothetical protein
MNREHVGSETAHELLVVVALGLGLAAWSATMWWGR